MRGLVRCGARIVPEILPFLDRRDDESVVSAARILCALPTTTAGAALAAAVTRPRSAAQLTALHDALAAGRISEYGQDDAALDAYLSQLGQSRREDVPQVADLPALHYRSGRPVSPDATRWLLGELAADGEREPRGGLAIVRQRLADADAARLLDAIQASIPMDAAWLVSAIGTLGNDAQLDKLGAIVNDWSETDWHELMTHAVQVLQRSGCGCAFAWLAHWAEYATAELRRDANAALRRLCEERALDRDTLLDLTTPRAPENPEAAIAAAARRLEAAMIVGRTFDREHFEAFVMEHPIVRKAAIGLVFLDAKERPAILTAAGFIDGDGAKVTPEAPLSIAHPCTLSDPVLAALGGKLSELGLAQPFPQTAREFSRNAKEELFALRNQKLPPRTLLQALKALGYRPGAVEQGVVSDAYRPLAAGFYLVARHDGIFVKDSRCLNGTRKSTVEELSAQKQDDWAEPTRTLDSEALLDLRKLLTK